MQQLMQKVTHYMQNSQFVKALTLCNNILSSGNNHPQIHMMKAICLGNTSHLEEACEIFENLIAHFPKNPEIFYNFALILQENNDLNRACKNYIQCLKINPNHFSAWNNLGIIYRLQKQHDLALDAFIKSHRLQPNNIEYIRNLANQYYLTHQYLKCIDLLYPLFDTPNRVTEDDFVIGTDSLYKIRDMPQAQSLYKLGLQLFPKNKDLLNIAGLIETDNKKYKIAENLISQAVAIDPSNLEFNTNLLTAQSHIEKHSSSIVSAILTLIKNHKDTIQVYEFSSALLDSLNKSKELKKTLSAGLKINSLNPYLLFYKAKLKNRRKKYNKALKLLKLAEKNSSNAKLTIDINYERTRTLDKIKDFKKAWKAIIKTNKLNENYLVRPLTNKSLVEQANTLTYDFNKNFSLMTQLPSWKSYPKLVFVIGFPRSGTTLIEKILSAHPKTQILEETNAINEIYLDINKLNGESFFQKLYSLNSIQVKSLHDQYLNNLTHYINWDNESIVIDKMPMNSNHLALIHHLFPEAKILFMARHPIDVCISCLMQDMLQVFSFDEAASVYNSYMQVFDNYKKHLKLNLIEIKYESLVEDMHKQIMKVLDFIDLKWHENIELFYDKSTPANTPSYHQVNQPIYQQAKFRYKNYLPFIESKTNKLDKWINYFNYKI